MNDETFMTGMIVLVTIIIIMMGLSIRANGAEFLQCYEHKNCVVVLKECVDEDGIVYMVNLKHDIYFKRGY